MARSYRHIQEYEKEILELKGKGLTQSETTRKLGFTKKQVKGFFKRLHRKERRIAAREVLRRKGRPPKYDKFSETDKVNELKYIIARKDAKIKALEMERTYEGFSVAYRKEVRPSARDFELSELIRECQIESRQIYGYRRATVWLERHSIHHNPKTILRVMEKYSLFSVVRRRRYYNYSRALHRYDNLLNRDFNADRPNQKWVTDISYIKTAQGFLYLSVIRDLYDRSIVAYKTSTVQNINLVLNTIRAAKKREKVTGELQLHSDQGVQYTSQPYFNLIKEYHIIPSMSRRGNPYDNALAENFFSILKTECIYRTKINSFAEARKFIDDSIISEFKLKQN